MKTIPSEIKADGLKIYAEIGGLNMPLSEETINHHCGHIPKTEMEAKVMARRLRGKRLDFPNISFGQQKRKIKTLTGNRDNPNYRRERIERRKRRERGVVKVTIHVQMESDYKDHEVSLALLNIENIKKVKKISKIALEFELERKGVTQKIFEETIYPEIKEKLPYVKEYEGHDFAD